MEAHSRKTRAGLSWRTAKEFARDRQKWIELIVVAPCELGTEGNR